MNKRWTGWISNQIKSNTRDEMRNRDCSFSSFPSLFSAKWSDSPSIIIHPTTDYPAYTAAYHPVQFTHLVPLFLRQGMSHVLRILATSYEAIPTSIQHHAVPFDYFRDLDRITAIQSENAKCSMLRTVTPVTGRQCSSYVFHLSVHPSWICWVAGRFNTGCPGFSPCCRISVRHLTVGFGY